MKKVAGGTTTLYLVDTRNPSGYAQVLEELTANVGTNVYTYGLDLISQRRLSSQPSTNYFIYDGQGSTRLLADEGGNTVNAFTYDAFGTLIASNTTAQTAYLYSGEQFDPDLGFYYLRARYLNPNTGRFWTIDTFAGNNEDPLSLHKYLYAADNPIDRTDPSGNDDIGIGDSLDSMSLAVFSSVFSHALDTVVRINFWEDPGYYGWGWPKGVKIDKWVHGTPPNSQTFVALDGENFLAPSEADFNVVYFTGKANGPNPFGIASAVGPFGKFDFQRNRGQGVLSVNTFYPAYTDASNYGVGVFMNGCGFSLDETITIGTTFAHVEETPNANNPRLKKWWTLGWNAAHSGSPNGSQAH